MSKFPARVLWQISATLFFYRLLSVCAGPVWRGCRWIPTPRPLARDQMPPLRCIPSTTTPRSVRIPLAEGFTVARAAESVLCLDPPPPPPTRRGQLLVLSTGQARSLVDFTGFRCSPVTSSCCVWGFDTGIDLGWLHDRWKSPSVTVEPAFNSSYLGARSVSASMMRFSLGPLLGRSPHNPDSHPSGHSHDNQVLSPLPAVFIVHTFPPSPPRLRTTAGVPESPRVPATQASLVSSPSLTYIYTLVCLRARHTLVPPPMFPSIRSKLLPNPISRLES
ncbi:hypothetical protein VTG60DRAFT_6689 [Thermothelomyces hinnuleus]